jgi:hypothetical protein
MRKSTTGIGKKELVKQMPHCHCHRNFRNVFPWAVAEFEKHVFESNLDLPAMFCKRQLRVTLAEQNITCDYGASSVLNASGSRKHHPAEGRK